MQRWDHFKNNFMTYFDVVANDNLRRFSQLSTDVFFEFSCIMLHGSEMSFLRLVTDALLSKILDTNAAKKKRATFEVTINNTKTECEYLSSSVHVEVDIEKAKGTDKQLISEFVSNHVAATKSIYKNKHIIVLHGVEHLSQIASFALRKVLECQRNNTVFIMTCCRVSKVCGAITSRSAMLRCNISTNSTYEALDMLMTNLNIDEIKIHDNNTLITTLVTQSASDGIPTIIHKFMTNLIKVDSVEKAFSAIRTFGYACIALNIPLSLLCREVLQFSHAHSKDIDMCAFVQLAASLEHKSLSTNKTNLAIERLLLYAYIPHASKNRYT